MILLRICNLICYNLLILEDICWITEEKDANKYCSGNSNEPKYLIIINWRSEIIKFNFKNSNKKVLQFLDTGRCLVDSRRKRCQQILLGTAMRKPPKYLLINNWRIVSFKTIKLYWIGSNLCILGDIWWIAGEKGINRYCWEQQWDNRKVPLNWRIESLTFKKILPGPPPPPPDPCVGPTTTPLLGETPVSPMPSLNPGYIPG